MQLVSTISNLTIRKILILKQLSYMVNKKFNTAQLTTYHNPQLFTSLFCTRVPKTRKLLQATQPILYEFMRLHIRNIQNLAARI